MPLAADERERRLIPEMILDLALLDARAVQLGRERVGDTRDARVLHDQPRALGGGRCGDGGPAR